MHWVIVLNWPIDFKLTSIPYVGEGMRDSIERYHATNHLVKYDILIQGEKTR